MMPIVNISPPGIGTKLKFVGPAYESAFVPDLTLDRIYVLAGTDKFGAPFVYDDVGDKNFAVADGGAGDFEIVA